MPEEQAEESEQTETENSEVNGYKCVNCEADVSVDPVEDKIICPKCSHRVLMKKRPEDPVTVEAK